jgi:hypothetical protein
VTNFSHSGKEWGWSTWAWVVCAKYGPKRKKYQTNSLGLRFSHLWPPPSASNFGPLCCCFHTLQPTPVLSLWRSCFRNTAFTVTRYVCRTCKQLRWFVAKEYQPECWRAIMPAPLMSTTHHVPTSATTAQVLKVTANVVWTSRVR